LKGDLILVMLATISQNLQSSRLLPKYANIRIYNITILPVVLYGYQTCYLTSRQEHRLRVFENKVLRRIFGPKRDEMTGEWRKLLNEELRDLYSSPSIIRVIKWRRMRWTEHVAWMIRRGMRMLNMARNSLSCLSIFCKTSSPREANQIKTKYRGLSPRTNLY
jgi:hypothetical protein